MKRYFIELNRSQQPILLHPLENIPFESREVAEKQVKQLKQDSKNEFIIFEYMIREVDFSLGNPN